MPRPVSLLPALVAMLATAVPWVQPAPAQAAGGADDRPPRVTRSAARTVPAPVRNDDALLVSIQSMTPSALRVKETRVQLNGSVTNQSDETWRAINLHPFVGDEPITTSAQLAEETRRDPHDYVGDRITRTGTFDNVPELAPGESAQFSIKFSSSVLGLSEPGVYWFGVHAIGETDSQPRDGVADGRARTFLPMVGRTRRSLPTALVLPIRHRVLHSSDGRVDDVRGWAHDLADGPLRSMVDFGASAGSRPLTWLVDPAVPEAVQALVTGNVERSLDDTVVEPPVGGTGDASSGPEAGSRSPSPEETPGPDAEEVPANPATEPGNDWLNRFREAVDGHQVLALPYGDLDVSAAVHHDSQTYRDARRRSGRELAPFGIAASPAVGAPDGYLAPEALDVLPDRATVLVGEQVLGDEAPGLARVSGHRLVVTSHAANGGPGPDDPLSTVSLRQQILSEAAVRLLGPRHRELTVVLPDDWAPSSTNGFFQGLDVSWVELTDLQGLGLRRAPRIDREDLDYPDREQRRELDAANFAAASSLAAAGATLENVLVRNDAVAGTVFDEALTGLSYANRAEPDAARVSAQRSERWISGQLARVRVNAPRAVTLASSRGQFATTLVNGLDHPVEVKVEAVLDAPMKIQGPESIQIAANGRTSVLLDASTDRLGVSNVQLIVTDIDGTPLGSTDELPIRSGQVSQVIWLILGAGVALLFGAIVVRLVHRLRRRRWAR